MLRREFFNNTAVNLTRPIETVAVAQQIIFPDERDAFVTDINEAEIR